MLMIGCRCSQLSAWWEQANHDLTPEALIGSRLHASLGTRIRTVDVEWGLHDHCETLRDSSEHLIFIIHYGSLAVENGHEMAQPQSRCRIISLKKITHAVAKAISKIITLPWWPVSLVEIDDEMTNIHRGNSRVLRADLELGHEAFNPASRIKHWTRRVRFPYGVCNETYRSSSGRCLGAVEWSWAGAQSYSQRNHELWWVRGREKYGMISIACTYILQLRLW